MLLLSKSVLASCLAGARSAFPNEFIGLLEGEKTPSGDLLLTRLVVPPGIRTAPNSSGYMPWMVPPSIDHWGIFHSHPSFSNRPSRQDTASASKEGGIQLIACRPFTPASIKAYDSNGRPLEFKVV